MKTKWRHNTKMTMWINCTLRQSKLGNNQPTRFETWQILGSCWMFWARHTDNVQASRLTGTVSRLFLSSHLHCQLNAIFLQCHLAATFFKLHCHPRAATSSHAWCEQHATSWRHNHCCRTGTASASEAWSLLRRLSFLRRRNSRSQVPCILRIALPMWRDANVFQAQPVVGNCSRWWAGPVQGRHLEGQAQVFWLLGPSSTQLQ